MALWRGAAGCGGGSAGWREGLEEMLKGAAMSSRPQLAAALAPARPAPTMRPCGPLNGPVVSDLATDLHLLVLAAAGVGGRASLGRRNFEMESPGRCSLPLLGPYSLRTLNNRCLQLLR
jgi:hypothetical protein